MQELLRFLSLSLLIITFAPSLYNYKMEYIRAPFTRIRECGDSLFHFDSCKEFGTSQNFKCQYDAQFWPKFWPLSSVRMLPLIPCNQCQNALAWRLYRNKQFYWAQCFLASGLFKDSISFHKNYRQFPLISSWCTVLEEVKQSVWTSDALTWDFSDSRWGKMKSCECRLFWIMLVWQQLLLFVLYKEIYLGKKKKATK